MRLQFALFIAASCVLHRSTSQHNDVNSSISISISSSSSSSSSSSRSSNNDDDDVFVVLLKLDNDPSAARVQPWTSKGITDLLLLNFMRLNTACPSKKLSEQITFSNYLVG
ncbi:Mitochondrial import inner membrane translocase subunit [Dirofilaria immitis]